MNKRIANPLIVHFMADTKDRKVVTQGRRFYVPTNVAWQDFAQAVQPEIGGGAYDSVVVHVDKAIDLDVPGTVNGLTIKTNAISKAASNAPNGSIPVLSDAAKDAWYFLNPSWDEQQQAGSYAPSDETVLGKFSSYGSEAAWQEHQAHVWSRMADMMPLSDRDAFGTPNHVAALTDPKRGLERKDLDGFWSFKSGRMLSPVLMGDDMVGMPGVDGREYDGFTIVTQDRDGTTSEQPLVVKSIKTVGMSGIAIPMANADGNVPKYQIATDPSAINVRLKARAADGVSIQQSEYFDKKRNVFKFKFTDGTPSNLRVAGADSSGKVVFSDKKGNFTTQMKANVTDFLKERGYDLPDLIAKVTVEPNAKYIWQSRGNMVGSEEVCKTVSPSNAGFVLGQEPKNGEDSYILVVAEGALKGRIVAKYVDAEDMTGTSFGDRIAGDRGVIIAQVPGVSRQFVESVKPIYDKYPIKGTLIAMDADGRENRAVADGIASAYDCLSEKGPVKVMSWNPAQKGLDDALLAVAQKRITFADMGIKFGTPEELFPKKAAKRPNPYRLDGTRANRQEWQMDYSRDHKLANAKILALQEETKRRAAEALDRNSYVGKEPGQTDAKADSSEKDKGKKPEPEDPKKVGKELADGIKDLGDDGEQL